MMIEAVAEPFQQTPLGVALISFTCFAMITMAGAAIKLVVQMTRMQASVTQLIVDVSNLKNDPDVMRWSNYGRAVQAMHGSQIPPGSI